MVAAHNMYWLLFCFMIGVSNAVVSDEQLCDENPTDPTATAFSVLQITFAVIGIVGNLLVFVVVCTLKEYKKASTHLYILQLSFSDLVFLVNILVVADDTLKGEGSYIASSQSTCSASNSILQLNYYVSVIVLVVMGIDRYIGVCHSFSAALHRLQSTTSVIVISVVVWVFCVLLCIPYMQASHITACCRCGLDFGLYYDSRAEYEACVLNKELHCDVRLDHRYMPEHCGESGLGGFTGFTDFEGLDTADIFELLGFSNNFTHQETPDNRNATIKGEEPDQNTMSSCKFKPEWEQMMWINFVVFYVIPLIVLLMTYGSIINKMVDTRASVKQAGGSVNNGSAGGGGSSMNQVRRVTTTCIALVTCFAVCWLPFHIIHLAKVYGINVNNNTCNILEHIGSLFGTINATVNPYIYTIAGANFKRRFLSAYNALCGGIKPKDSVSSKSNMTKLTKRGLLSSLGGTRRNNSTSDTNHSTSASRTAAEMRV